MLLQRDVSWSLSAFLIFSKEVGQPSVISYLSFTVLETVQQPSRTSLPHELAEADLHVKGLSSHGQGPQFSYVRLVSS